MSQEITDAITDANIHYVRRKLLSWGREHYQEFVWRDLSNQWFSLVVEIMLQRTRAEQVEPVFIEFMQHYSTPADYLADDDSDVFAGLGLPHRREWLKALARKIVDSEIPADREQLLDLPGVGDYIASAFRSLHLNLRDRIIDSNVVRFYGRFFGFETHAETRRKRWFIDFAERITPARVHRDYNYALLDFSRGICSTSPACDRCPLTRKCAFYQQRDT